MSIQVNLSGLSFCILNRSTNTVESLHNIDFEKKLTPFDLLNRLKTELSSNTIFSDDFNYVQVIHQNELSTIVPKALYNEDHNADYLKFNSKILKTDYISHDLISINDAVNVYIPYININNYIFETFGSFVYKHASTVLIDTVLQKHIINNQTQAFINVGEQAFELLIVSDKTLQLYNTFEYHSTEDFAYYVLFTIQQLQLDPETLITHLTGAVTDDDSLFMVLHKYIRHVNLLESSDSYGYHESISEHQKRQNFIVLNSF